jgi:glycerol kinase
MLVGLDIGSSSAKVIVLDARGRALRLERRRFSTRRAADGRVEHDAEEIHAAALSALRAATRVTGRTGARLGLATQRSTLLIWDRVTGRPLTPAWSWQDLRAAAACRRLAARDRTLERDLVQRTGLRLSAHYSAPKLAHALRKSTRLRRAIVSGQALWGTLSTFLIWRLTEGAVWAIDHANAQRTLLMRLADQAWDADLVSRLGLAPLLDAPALPALLPTRLAAGAEIRLPGRRLILGASTGDQQAALEGLRCRRAGDVAINYGSGAFVLIRVGGAAARAHGLLTSLADSRHAPSGGHAVSYAVEGTVNAAATALDWVQRRVGTRIRTIDLDRALGATPWSGRRDLHFLPAVSGLGAPRWDPAARPRFAGPEAGATPLELLAAAVESIAQRCAEIVRAGAAHVSAGRDAASAERSGAPQPTRVRVSGGLTRCRRLLQAQADLLQQPVAVSSSADATAIGAALLASADPATPYGAAREEERAVVLPRLNAREAARRWRAWERAVYGREPAADDEDAAGAAGAAR